MAGDSEEYSADYSAGMKGNMLVDLTVEKMADCLAHSLVERTDYY
jgi:hypothetical protein